VSAHVAVIKAEELNAVASLRQVPARLPRLV